MKVRALMLMLLLALFCIILVKAQDVPNTRLNVVVNNGQALAFQNTRYNFVRLGITSGVLNCTNGTLGINSGGGYFVFTALNDTAFTLTHNVTNVKVGGDSGNEFRQVYNGNSFTILAGNGVTVNWDMPGIEPWLPVMFILGMTGLVSLFGGSLYAVDKIKKKQYQVGLINGVIFVSIGFALFISWLWA